MKEPPDPGKPHYTCLKTSLKNIARNDVVIEKVNNAVTMCNKIVIHTYQFMKLYMLYCLEKNLPFPTIDKPFVTSVMKTLCNESAQGRPPTQKIKELKDTLKTFYEKHYKPLKQEELSYRYMNTVIDYLSIDIITMYENNIKMHLPEYVERFVNTVWKKKQLVAHIKAHKKTKSERQKFINKLCRELRKIKQDLLCVEDVPKTSLPLYHPWIDEVKATIIPDKTFEKDSLYYDLCCSPQDYLPCMFRMMQTVEELGEKVHNVCPLRSEIIPKHIRIDTTSLVQLLFEKEHGKKSFYLTKGELVKNHDKLWKMFFKTHLKIFHLDDNYSHTFHHMIETDGVGCSVVLIRRDMVGKKPRVSKKDPLKQEAYIDDLEDYTHLKDKTIVGIDPNMSDLLYCVTGDTMKTFRYTQNQRRKETKHKKYRDLLLSKKNEKIGEKTVTELETELSHYNKKTLNFNRFKDYIGKKNILNYTLQDFYGEYLHRKLKLGSYIRRGITEQRMLARFEKTFGSPQEVVIGFGDFEQKKHRKYKEPLKGKGFRTLFRKAGYEVYLVDEFRTSCRCSACEGECSTFRECINPRFWMREKQPTVFRHGLVMCKTCSRVWNRDTNGALNMYKVMNETIQGNGRPQYLSRTSSSISDATSVSHNHDLHEDAKPQPWNLI